MSENQTNYISKCSKCGKQEVVIGPRGKGLCDECITKANAPYKNHNGFVNDLNQPDSQKENKKK